MNGRYLMVFCTVPDMKVAKDIAEKVVEEKMAACCNILPNVTSVFSWKNKVEEDGELMLLIKTVDSAFSKLTDRITEIHPYEVPEILALPVAAGNRNYLKWVEENVR